MDPLVLAARRQQSDRASAAIGQKLLQGWTMLGEECSNEGCYGVPLMRRPTPRPAKADDAAPGSSSALSSTSRKTVDPRRHCVVCGRDYVKESDMEAMHAFLGAAGTATATTTASVPNNASNKHSATIAQPGDQDEQEIEHSAAAKKRRFTTQPATSNLKGKGKASSVAVAVRTLLLNHAQIWDTLLSSPPYFHSHF